MVGVVLFLVSLCKIFGWDIKRHESAGVKNIFLFVPVLLVYTMCWHLEHFGKNMVKFNYQNMSSIIVASCTVYCLFQILPKTGEIPSEN